MMSMSAASAALAAGAAPAFFAELVALLVIGALVAYVCHRLGLVPIVGFLLAGVVIGPSVLGLIDDRAQIDALAELGVILVLFTIGVEFSLERLARIKTLIFGGGGLQVGLTTVAVCALLMPLGVSWQIGVFTGFLVALSSTAIVLKLLGDNYEGSEETSRVALGLLIFQDLAIVLMVLLVPMLGGAAGDTTSVAMALLRAVLVIVAVLVVARRLLPPLLERVARTCSPELFLMSIVAICFGTAYLTSLAGVSLSLGAFLAGLMVSESRFSLHALTEVMPLQILFSAAFFISVGMLLDLGFVARNLLLVMAVVLGMTVLKIAIAALSVRLLGYGWPTAIASAFTLGQIGEFSFVLAKAGEAVALFPAGRGDIGSQTFIAAAVLSMMATPGMARLGNHLGAWLDRRRASASTDIVPAGSADASDDLHGHG
ncbi:MAG: cation:proton antiporter, partial [Acidobacteriota bacterium]